jgi:hypothetical protein
MSILGDLFGFRSQFGFGNDASTQNQFSTQTTDSRQTTTSIVDTRTDSRVYAPTYSYIIESPNSSITSKKEASANANPSVSAPISPVNATYPTQGQSSERVTPETNLFGTSPLVAIAVLAVAGGVVYAVVKK